MKAKSNQNMKRESGITLIALIITVILLVILAAVTIRSIWEMNIIKIASDAVIDYASEQQKETNTLDDITKIIGQITGDDLTLLKPTVTLTGTNGNDNVYSSDVAVRIKDSMSVGTLAKLEMHYIIEGLNEGREYTVNGRETSITVTEEGRYKVIAWIQDNKGNKSENEEAEFIIDKSKPSDPRISLTGTEGDNEYYIDNKVGVTIEAGENIISGVSAIKYRVEGANPVAETTVYADTANFEIVIDGESTIYAKIINNAGVVSEEINRTMKKDSAKPNVATLTYNTCDTSTITVTATGQDSTSKVKSYIFEKSTDNKNFSVVEEVLGGDGTKPYTYKNLTDGTKYYLRVTIKDNAGLTQESNIVEQTTVKANSAPTFNGTPTVAKVANSNSSLTVTAKATDPDGDSLTYTLCDATGNAITTNVTQSKAADGTVTFTHSGLENYSTHTYVVKVTDNKAGTVKSGTCEGTTWCLGSECEGTSVKVIPDAVFCDKCRNNSKCTYTVTPSYNPSSRGSGTNCFLCGSYNSAGIPEFTYYCLGCSRGSEITNLYICSNCQISRSLEQSSTLRYPYDVQNVWWGRIR